MRPKIGGYIAIAVGAAIAVGIFGTQNDGEIEITDNRVFHVTLADPQKYENGTFVDSLKIEEGIYEFRFVSNGDSPKILTISVVGESFYFSENFNLEGTPHKTGISTYYTWDYSGEKKIEIQSEQVIQISIDPNENLLGPVSVDIIKE